MCQYTILPLQSIIAREDAVQMIISKFSCPLNSEVEIFLRDKSVEFEKMDLSRTYFVFTEYNNKQVLLGYYAITIKDINLAEGVSNKNRKLIAGFSSRKSCSVHLIGQLAKNYKNNIHELHLITGKRLLELAIERILLAYQIIGGRAILVECENKEKLRKFYESNGFHLVDKDPEDHLLRYYINIDSIKVCNET